LLFTKVKIKLTVTTTAIHWYESRDVTFIVYNSAATHQ